MQVPTTVDYKYRSTPDTRADKRSLGLLAPSILLHHSDADAFISLATVITGTG